MMYCIYDVCLSVADMACSANNLSHSSHTAVVMYCIYDLCLSVADMACSADDLSHSSHTAVTASQFNVPSQPSSVNSLSTLSWR